LELVAGVALLLALVTQLGWLGWFMAAGGLLLIWIARQIILAKQTGQAQVTLIEVLVLVAIVAMLVSLCLPAISVAREATRRGFCRHQMQQIMQAFHAYHDKHGHFPPPFIADSSGKPMHSWRVLILPHLERSDLYEQYDFSEPWNGPNNSKLAAAGPSIYRCPSHGSVAPGFTSYFCVVGPGRTRRDSKTLLPAGERLREGRLPADPPLTPALSPAGRGSDEGGTGASQPQQTLGDFADGPTIMLVESHAAQVNWLEPRDLTVEDLLTGKHPAPSPGAFLVHHGGGDGKAWRGHPCFHCAMDDGSVQAIRLDVGKDALHALLTIDGGEAVDLESLSGMARLWPGVWVLLAAEVAFLAFAITRRVRIARRVRQEAQHG
jgi:type II secretory pathway pseudopilin PulG